MIGNTRKKDTERGVQERKKTQASKQTRRPYISPKIITHSAEKLRQAPQVVNACSSFIP